MKNFANRTSRILSPGVLLTATLAVSLALAMLPSHTTQPLRNAWREALRPGQQFLATGNRWLQTARSKWRGDDDPPGDATQQIAELREQIGRLELELLLERSRPVNVVSPSDAAVSPSSDIALAGYSSPPMASPLLLAQTIPARVLGRQAKAFLLERDMLDVGRLHGTMRDALVIDAASPAAEKQWLDQGRDANVQPNRLVLAGRRVWGQTADVGTHTSTVRRVNDAGYRDLVQLATRRDGRLNFFARGMLVGRGEPLAKIELVETTQPVTVGDLVFTADDGVLEMPLLYGRVVKLERKPGAAHWEIWMEPAVATADSPARVAVLRMELNSARLDNDER